MGNFMSGRFPQGRGQAALRDASLILNARELVKGGVVGGIDGMVGRSNQ